MTHKFNVSSKNKLDNPKRRELLPPVQTLLCLDLDEGDIMADIGCGVGYFTIPAADIVGKNGEIYALDIVNEMLDDVNTKIEENSITNIHTILTEENDLKLEDGKVTFAFVSFVLHEAEDKEKFLTEVKRIVMSKGRIVVIEWQKINSEFGPPINHRLDKDEVIEILKKLNLSNIRTINIGKDFYGVIADKINEEEIEDLEMVSV